MTSPRRIRLARLAGHLSLAAVLGSAATAQADILDPGTRPAFASFGLGPAIGAVNLGGVTQFKMEQQLGYHFSGDSSGIALGLQLAESVGSGVFIFQPGAKLAWDAQVADDLAIYITPSLALGYAGAFGGGSAHAFNWQIAAEVKAILGDRGLLFFRPIGLDFFAGDFGGTSFAMRYDLILGGGVTF